MLEVNRSYSPAPPVTRTRAPFVWCSFGVFCCGNRLCRRKGKRAEGRAPPMAEQHRIPRRFMAPCLVIYLQLNSGDGRGQVFHLDKKKGALLKGTDLSITLRCRHGAFIAFLSTSPFPFLNHNNSPPPRSPSSQETWWFLFIFTDTCTAAFFFNSPLP